MLEKLGEKPVKRVMKADPTGQNVKVYNLVRPIVEFDGMKGDRLVLRTVQPIILQSAHNQYVVNHSLDGIDKLSNGSLAVGLAIDFDDTRQGEGNIKNADPSIRLVFHMVRDCAQIGIDPHEHLTYFGEASDELEILSDDTLHSAVGTDVS